MVCNAQPGLGEGLVIVFIVQPRLEGLAIVFNAQTRLEGLAIVFNAQTRLRVSYCV